ncbi:hypothetical protein CJG84_23675 [Salmonella enterica]|nr:hypothetical protein [Salmonella enterica]EBY0806356.1 hypothetical protein [Salmonella enterica subsp. enterica serovar Berlin]ECT9551379.1 hypothetical protein [Salmonella enterica]ECU8314491.1 hypothetical protein [Salmonella enterica subsp. enterica serovar Oslo]
MIVLGLGVKKIIAYSDPMVTFMSLARGASKMSYISCSICSLFSERKFTCESFFSNFNAAQFTQTERFILKRLLSGNTLQDIALKHKINLKTVHTHQANIRRKLSIRKIYQLFL